MYTQCAWRLRGVSPACASEGGRAKPAGERKMSQRLCNSSTIDLPTWPTLGAFDRADSSAALVLVRRIRARPTASRTDLQGVRQKTATS